MINTLVILAQSSDGGGGILGSPIIMMVLMFVIFWVLLIRPQQKQRKELAAKQNALKKGDKVITIGGMHASVNSVGEKTVSLKIAEGQFVKYDKTAIATVINPKSEITEKKKEEKKGG